MKKISFTVIIVGLIDILFFFPILWFIGFTIWDPGCFSTDHLNMEISFKNAPENTVYVDLLIKENADDARTVSPDTEPKIYRERKKEDGGSECIPLNINENSEIALLNDDGYISYTMHHHGDITIYDSGRIIFDSPIGPHGDLKAAYVDENGNVLGITETASQGYNGEHHFTLSADGDRAAFAKPCRPDWAEAAAVYGAFIIEGAAFLALIVFIVLAIVSVVKRRLERRRS